MQLWESPSPMGSPRAESTGQRSPASSRKGLVLSPPTVLFVRRSEELEGAGSISVNTDAGPQVQ